MDSVSCWDGGLVVGVGDELLDDTRTCLCKGAAAPQPARPLEAQESLSASRFCGEHTGFALLAAANS